MLCAIIHRRGAPVAGSLAGVTSTVTCFPLEVLRTRLAVSTEVRNSRRQTCPQRTTAFKP